MTFCILLGGFADDAYAAKKKKKASSTAENPRYSALVMDATTGEILMARNADSIRHPASLTKMMTLYMLFEAIDGGRVRMNDRIPITSRAAGMAPSKLGLPAGSSIAVEDAIKALVTKSANDISTAIGEKLGGSEKRFASNMTRRARELGMSRTTFRNASGLPDPQQVTTARDMARLAQALINDHSKYYHYFGIRNFEYRGAVHGNHNRLLGHYAGLDGIKTGYINASGFNLVASAKQNGRRLIGVVFGGRSTKSRNDHMVKILDQGFLEIGKRKGMIQEASLSPTSAPVPLPPPMLDDIRGVSSMALSEENATDGAEDSAITESQMQPGRAPITEVTFEPLAPADLNPASPSLGTSMIERVDIQPATPDTPASATSTITTVRASTITANGIPIPPPRPTQQRMIEPTPARTQTALNTASAPKEAMPAAPLAPAASFQMAPVARGVKSIQTASAPTVMQLTLKRDQLPAGLANQIASNTSGRSWSVQVGAFHSRAMTDQALRTAQSRLPTHLQHARAVIVPQNTGGAILFRGRLQGFDEVQANAACAQLGACLVVAPGS